MDGLVPLIVDVCIVLLAVFIIYRSAKRGFVKTAVELIGFVLAAVIALSLSSIIAESVFEKRVRPAVVTSIEENLKIKTDDNTQNLVVNAWGQIPSALRGVIEISGFDIHEFSKDIDKTVDNTAHNAAVKITDDVLKPIITSGLKLVLLIVLFIILLICFKLLAKLLNTICKIPLLKPINRLLGGVLGFAKAAVIICLLVAVISIAMPLFNNKIGIFTPELIENTYIFKYLYKFNPFA